MKIIVKITLAIVRFSLLLFAVMSGVNAFAEVVDLISGKYPSSRVDLLIISIIVKTIATIVFALAYRWLGRWTGEARLLHARRNIKTENE